MVGKYWSAWRKDSQEGFFYGYKSDIGHPDIRDGNLGNNRLNYGTAPKSVFDKYYISKYLVHTVTCLRSEKQFTWLMFM